MPQRVLSEEEQDLIKEIRRDIWAGIALLGLLVHPARPTKGKDLIAAAWEIADLMEKER
jgi:hypothetical protein